MEKAKQLLKLMQKKKLLVLPLLALLLITILIVLFAQSKGNKAVAQQTKSTGLNPQLPGPGAKEEKFDTKMSFYQKADRDSARYKEQIKRDPYYRQEMAVMNESAIYSSGDPYPVYSSKNAPTYQDPNEEKVYRKLAQLNEQLSSTVRPAIKLKEHQPSHTEKTPVVKTEDIDRLENMMQMMNEADTAEDPEMKQLNQLLEKVLDVQHPDRVRQRAQWEQSAPDKDITDTVKNRLLSIPDPVEKVRFYSISEKITNAKADAVAATVPENQVLVNGAVVKLMLTGDIDIRGQLIPKGQLVFGIAELNNERLNINISSIRYGNDIYAVRLQVYDVDGMEGIYVPGAISREVAKQSANNAVQSMELLTIDNSLSAQAATAGVNAAKSFLTKKVKQVRVTLKAGYQVLLKDKEVKQ